MYSRRFKCFKHKNGRTVILVILCITLMGTTIGLFIETLRLKGVIAVLERQTSDIWQELKMQEKTSDIDTKRVEKTREKKEAVAGTDHIFQRNAKTKTDSMKPEDVVADLIPRVEIIPYDGVLGGRMGFHNRDGIKVLNSRWVLAEFDDGHILGAMLLQYEVTAMGSIEWKVLDSCLY